MDQTATHESKAMMGNWPWWLFLIVGVAWLFLSIIVLRFDITSVTAVAYLLGALFVAIAANEFMTMAMVVGWGWLHAILGVFFALGAIFAFIHPYNTFYALASVLGFLLVMMGAFYIFANIATKEDNPVWGLGLAAGILEVLLGFWVAQRYFPARAELILIWVGFMAMFRGIGEIVMAFQIRRLQTS
jgi:uncharacterized membrane protein HdeD (DUF308 family)